MKKQVKIAAAKKITVRQVFNHTASPVDKFCLGVTSERSWTKTKNLNFTEQNDLFFFLTKLAEFSLRHLFQLFQIEEKKLSILYHVQLYLAYTQLDIQFDVLSYGLQTN